MAKQKQPKKTPPRSLKDVVAAPPNRPSLESFLDHLFAKLGGPEAVAALMADDCLAADPGSMLRARLWESMLRLLKGADAKGNPLDDVDNLTDADIDRLLDEREGRLRKHLDKPHAPAEPGRPGPAGDPPPGPPEPPAPGPAAGEPAPAGPAAPPPA
jgi:hypothetical protein